MAFISLLTRKQKSLAKFERGETGHGGTWRIILAFFIGTVLVEGVRSTFHSLPNDPDWLGMRIILIVMSKLTFVITALFPCFVVACLCI